MELPYETSALIKSINGWGRITVLERQDKNNYTVEYNGNKYTAFYSTWIDAFVIYDLKEIYYDVQDTSIHTIA